MWSIGLFGRFRVFPNSTATLKLMSFNALGAQQYARDVGRMFVSGHAPNVGIVGWSVGGGHGQLVPMLGMGADQVCNLSL